METNDKCWVLVVNPSFINGRGLFEMENHQGYTMNHKEAGTFTIEHAYNCENLSNGKVKAFLAEDAEKISNEYHYKIKKPEQETLTNCPDCNVKPGQPHNPGCDVERCSVCGNQKLGCHCKGHDIDFARWTGLWPASAESAMLGIDLNEFYRQNFHKIFFVKPKSKEEVKIPKICKNCTYWKQDWGTWCANGWSGDGTKGYCQWDIETVMISQDRTCGHFEPSI